MQIIPGNLQHPGNGRIPGPCRDGPMNIGKEHEDPTNSRVSTSGGEMRHIITPVSLPDSVSE